MAAETEARAAQARGSGDVQKRGKRKRLLSPSFLLTATPPSAA
jgi:hypothetical protein